MTEYSNELKEKALAVKKLRDKIKELTEYKEQCEDELEKELKALDPEKKTHDLGGVSVTLSASIRYELSDSGNAILHSIPFSDAVWKKEPNMAVIRKDARFSSIPNTVVENYGKTKMTLKEG